MFFDSRKGVEPPPCDSVFLFSSVGTYNAPNNTIVSNYEQLGKMGKRRKALVSFVQFTHQKSKNNT